MTTNLDRKEIKLTPDVLKLRDSGEVCRQIEAFIREKVKELRKDGVIFGLSGGLDSCVVAYLCARAIEPKKILGLYMPDKDSNPKHGEDARKVADILGIKFETINLTPLLQIQGIYDVYPINLLNLLPGKRLKGWAMKTSKYLIEKITKRNLFIESHQGSGDKFVAGGSAYAHFKRRQQMVITYLYADLENLLVVGAANRTEYLTGVFVKFGIDGLADIMPLLPLYKTQVKQLANHLGVPKDIIEKPADPDLFPGFTNKEKMFGKEETLDLILLGLERGLSPSEIVAAQRIDLKNVEKVQVLIDSSKHLRESPYVLDLKL